MQNKKELIINKIFKTLPVFEQYGYENFHAYLDRVIPELENVLNDDSLAYKNALEESINALKGLFNQDVEEVTHSRVKRVILHYTNYLSKKIDFIEVKGE